jgi:tetratricopeptide (TPR) repeat protein
MKQLYFATLIGCEEISSQRDRAVNDIRLACLTNLAALFNHCQQFAESIKLSQKALEIDSRNVKALFRKAQAQDNLSQTKEALDTTSQLLAIEPGNAQAVKFRDELNRKLSGSAPATAEVKAIVPEPPRPVAAAVRAESERAEEEKKEKESAAAPPPPPSGSSGDYGFMNPNWTPLSTQDAVPAVAVNMSSSTAAALAESEKTRIKNELFASALKSKLSAGDKAAGSAQGAKTGTLNVREEVVSTLQELSMEEEHVVQQLKAKGSSLKKAAAGDGAVSGSTKKNKAAGGTKSGTKDRALSSKRVISDRARDEWASLMNDEDDIKKKAAAKLASLNGTPPSSR